MPNLYKQYTVHTQPEKKRIINSNDIIEQRLESILKLQREEQRQQDGDGFSAGIIGTDTPYVEETNPVEEAKEEAEQLVADAKKEAEQLVQQAKEEAESIRMQAKQSGYLEGKKELEAEFEEKSQTLEETFRVRMQSLENEYSEKRESMEKDLVDVILDVFNRVFHIQFDNKKHILMYLIDDAILNIEGDKKFRIKVADSNVLFLENHKEEILERVGHGIEIEIIADSSMGGSDCVIETDSGVFDCSLGVQLENLMRDLKSLCS